MTTLTEHTRQTDLRVVTRRMNTGFVDLAADVRHLAGMVESPRLRHVAAALMKLHRIVVQEIESPSGTESEHVGAVPEERRSDLRR